MQAAALTMPTLGERVRAQRLARRWSLEALAEASGVSRSMLSEIERAAKVPTVLVLDRIATALGTTISRLVETEVTHPVTLLRRDDQHVMRDPGGWQRRILSPVIPGVEFEFMRTTLGPRVDAGVFPAHRVGSREYIAVEAGRLELTLNGTPYELRALDSIYFAGDCLHGFRNPGRSETTYYLAMDVTPGLHVLHGSHSAKAKSRR